MYGFQSALNGTDKPSDENAESEKNHHPVLIKVLAGELNVKRELV
jgi:hypothetical protein